MITRKVIMYETLVEYYKQYKDKSPELLSRKADVHRSPEVAIDFALHTVKEINRSKKKLLRITGYTNKDMYGIDADAHSPAWIKKDIYETLNKWLEKCDYVCMTFSYADNKIVEVIINKTKHNHHYA
jgi:phage-related protein